MRVAHPQVTFADLAFIEQGVQLEPTLQAIAEFLDEHSDLGRKYETGRIVDHFRKSILRELD